MAKLSVIENKLDKIKKSVSNDIERIYVWIHEDMPIRFDLITKSKGLSKYIYCNSFEEYKMLLEKYQNINIIQFIGVKKPNPEDVAIS